MQELPGLYFMRARFYSADAAVFLSTDPVKNIGPGWKPELFGYADGSPLNNFDADGNMSRETTFRYQQAVTHAYYASLDAAYAQAEADVWQGIYDSVKTLGAVGGGAAGIALGLANQVAGVGEALGFRE